MFGITHAEPAKPLDEKHFAHATASSLMRTPWKKLPFALGADEARQETILWAPHVILFDNAYYMFYVAGGDDHTRYKINLATSSDLKTWTRHPKNPLVVDGYDARDPFILRDKNR
jgi:sucrose-6-phosphate hydrolase SacC (GH32 family)